MDAYNFTARARAAFPAASDAAGALHHEYVGTEHLLLGLLHDRTSVATTALIGLGIDPGQIQRQITETVKAGRAAAPGGSPLPYTSRTKKVIELAMIAAREDNHAKLGTEHLLLGLIREKMGVAAQVLTHAGLTPAQVAAAVVKVREAYGR